MMSSGGVARGAIPVPERAAYMGRVRDLAKGCCAAGLASRDGQNKAAGG